MLGALRARSTQRSDTRLPMPEKINMPGTDHSRDGVVQLSRISTSN